MKLFISLSLVFFVFGFQQAHAELFKCKSAAGKTVYQPTPCEASDDATPLDITVLGGAPASTASVERENSGQANETSESPLEALKRSRREAQDGIERGPGH